MRKTRRTVARRGVVPWWQQLCGAACELVRHVHKVVSADGERLLLLKCLSGYTLLHREIQSLNKCERSDVIQYVIYKS